MTKRNRNALVIAGIIILVIGIWAGSIAASLSSAGMIEVDVRPNNSRGDQISIRIPAATAMGFLAIVPNAVFWEAADECGRYMPMVRELCDELSDLPDFTLVDVEGRHETVLIRKEGRSLIIDVDEGDETVHITIPLGLVGQVAKKIEKGRSIL